MKAVGCNKWISQRWIRGGRGPTHLVKSAPRTWPPDIVHLITCGLCNVVHAPIRPSDKETQDSVKIAVTHLVHDRSRVEFQQRDTPKSFPLAIEGIGAVLPRVHHVTRIKHSKQLYSSQEFVDGGIRVKDNTPAPTIADLSPLSASKVEQPTKFNPEHLQELRILT